MVFCFTSPFAPAKVVQCMKRIHRIGQHAPITGRVKIKHLVPYGSVDASIRRVHGDKTRLMNMVVDGEGMEETTEAQWKRTGRIVDGALPLNKDGNFAPMPQHMPTSDDSGTNGVAPNTPYTVVPGWSRAAASRRRQLLSPARRRLTRRAAPLRTAPGRTLGRPAATQADAHGRLPSDVRA